MSQPNNLLPRRRLVRRRSKAAAEEADRQAAEEQAQFDAAIDAGSCIEDRIEPTAEDARDYAEATFSRNFMARRQAGYTAAAEGGSAKFERLTEIVEEAAFDDRNVIVFSYFLDVLATVGRVLGTRAIGPVTGAMPAARRQELVDEFTNRRDPCVLVSQIEAGGVGPNIQAASVVIITAPQ